MNSELLVLLFPRPVDTRCYLHHDSWLQQLCFGLDLWFVAVYECARWQRGGTCALLLGTREASSEQLGVTT